MSAAVTVTNPKLPSNWKKQEEERFRKAPLRYDLHWRDYGGLQKRGAAGQYRQWTSAHSEQWRQRFLQLTQSWPTYHLQTFCYLFSSSKERAESGVRTYSRRCWQEVSQALSGRVRKLDDVESNRLLSHFLKAVDEGYSKKTKEEAWSLAAGLAQATFDDMKPGRKFLCFTLSGDKR